MTTFTTTITTLNTVPQLDGETDVVMTAFFKVTGVDGEYVAWIDSMQPFTLHQGEGFTPYNQLTQAQVISWIPEQVIQNMQQNVQEQIDFKKNPIPAQAPQPLPWG